MSVSKVGRRGVVVLPKEVRKRTGVKEGDELLVEVSESGIIYMLRRPVDPVETLSKAGKGLWASINPVDYVRKERESWET